MLLTDRGRSSRQEAFLLHNVLQKRREEVQMVGQEQKESNRRRSGTGLVATAPVVGRGGWGRARVLSRSVPAVLGR